jgi:hypothetical protein
MEERAILPQENAFLADFQIFLGQVFPPQGFGHLLSN